MEISINGSTVAVPTAEATKPPRKKRDADDPHVWVAAYWRVGRPTSCLCRLAIQDQPERRVMRLAPAVSQGRRALRSLLKL